jgi:hypothetical protein
MKRSMSVPRFHFLATLASIESVFKSSSMLHCRNMSKPPHLSIKATGLLLHAPSVNIPKSCMSEPILTSFSSMHVQLSILSKEALFKAGVDYIPRLILCLRFLIQDHIFFFLTSFSSMHTQLRI